MSKKAIKGKLKHEPHCPYCDHKLDGYTCVTEGADFDTEPKVGDITVCVECHAVLQFGIGLCLVPAPENAIENMNLLELSRAHELARVYQQVRKDTKKLKELVKHAKKGKREKDI